MTNLATPAPTPGFFAARNVYLGLQAPSAADFAGTYHQSIVGPAWYRAFALHMLGYVGLREWKGKRFDAQGNGVNLVGAEYSSTLPMTISIAPSGLDGKPAAVVRYAAGTPWPWPRFVDELRVLDAKRWLGVSYLQYPLVRGLTAAFVLERQ